MRGGRRQTGGAYAFLDLTALGRQEEWEEPKGRAAAGARGAPRLRRVAVMLSALSGTEWIGAGLIAAATIIGALMGRWSARYSAVSLAAVAGLLLVVVFGDLIPDIAEDLRGSGPGWWIAAALAGCASFAAAGVVLRRGCACGARAGGGAAALAIGVHRALEGSALAVTTSIPSSPHSSCTRKVRASPSPRCSVWSNAGGRRPGYSLRASARWSERRCSVRFTCQRVRARS